jgi:hypothetical protein
MNMSQWITFAKTTGKYLFSQVFHSADDKPLLQHLCDLLDYITDSLCSSLTKAAVLDLADRAKKLAAGITDFWPSGERQWVLHILVFHLPAALRLWGPARGFWVFPFERYVLHSTCVTPCH